MLPSPFPSASAALRQHRAGPGGHVPERRCCSSESNPCTASALRCFGYSLLILHFEPLTNKSHSKGNSGLLFIGTTKSERQLSEGRCGSESSSKERCFLTCHLDHFVRYERPRTPGCPAAPGLLWKQHPHLTGVSATPSRVPLPLSPPLLHSHRGPLGSHLHRCRGSRAFPAAAQTSLSLRVL